jgi:uncharacterized repeat protein (TIGR01451 family)
MNTIRALNAGNAVVTILLAAFLPLCPTAGLAIEFANPVSYPVGASPEAVVVADFNGDGHPDIAVANSGSGNVSVLLNNGDGTFKPAVNFDAGMASPTFIEVADFNNDGIQDLAVWNGTSPVSSPLTVLLGKGDGTFQAAKTTPLPATVDQATLDLAVADFNLDHKPGLALLVHDANAGTSRILVAAGNGDGTFQSPQPSSDAVSTVVGSGVRYLVTGDFNDDAKPDLAVQVSGGVAILLGQGDGTFHAGATVATATGFVVTDLKVGDVDLDGKVDLLVKSDQTNQRCSLSGHAGAARIGLFLGKGDGSFQSEQLIDQARWCTSGDLIGGRHPTEGTNIGVSSAADFNGDGRLDLQYQFTNYSDPASTTLRLGRNDGVFSIPIPIGSSVPWGVTFVAKDLNGDKLSDLIYLDSGNNAAVVLLNGSPTSGADLGIVEATAGQPLLDPSSSWYPADGRSFSYGAEIVNEGPRDATGVAYTGTLPAGVTFVSATVTQGSCSQSGRTVTCAIGSMTSGLDAAVTIAVTLNPTTREETLSSNMKVTANEPDLELANNTAAPSESVFTLAVSTDGTGSGTVTGGTPAGINCGATCSQGYLSGSDITLTASPAPGSIFTGWSNGGPCNGTLTTCGADTVQMWSNQTVTATFTKTLTRSGDPGGGGGAFSLWELCGMLLFGLWRRFAGNQLMPEDDRGV